MATSLQPVTPPAELRPEVKAYLAAAAQEFDQIDALRRQDLDRLAAYIRTQRTKGTPVHLLFVCTHNSRRSQFAQAWALAAADYYGLAPMHTYSGGTEVSAFNERAVKALMRAGWHVSTTPDTQGGGPRYNLSHRVQGEPLRMYSKRLSDAVPAGTAFGAVMVCGEADKACPYVPGAEVRVALPYTDPKARDGQPDETEAYDARCRQIARELLYVMHQAAR